MRALRTCLCVVLLPLAPYAAAADEQQSLDLRRVVPTDAYVAVYHKHNPERDFQREYFKEVWKTVEETQIIERALKIVTSRVSDEDLEKATSVLDELREAAEPIDVEAILNCREAVYGQSMEFPVAHHVAALRLSPDAAAGTETGIKNLFAMAEKYSGGEFTVQTSKEGDA
jgi:hypothetical protein